VGEGADPPSDDTLSSGWGRGQNTRGHAPYQDALPVAYSIPQCPCDAPARGQREWNIANNFITGSITIEGSLDDLTVFDAHGNFLTGWCSGDCGRGAHNLAQEPCPFR